MGDEGQDLAEPEEQKRSWGGDLFAGTGVGLLLGTIVGLSASAVVEVVIGTLMSLLAVFLGLEGSKLLKGDGLAGLKINHLRIGAFGFATLIGVLLGLFIRINNPLMEPLDNQLARWNAAFPDDPLLAKQMVIYERTGIQPKALDYGEGSEGPTEVTLQKEAAAAARSVLYSVFGKFKVCTQLNPERLSEASLLKNYRSANAPDYLAEVADRIEAMPASARGEVLIMTHDLLCTLHKEERRNAKSSD